jgi:hypothetical protein
LDTFSPCDIYNEDETGLFWKALPDCNLAFKNECVSGGKLSKERVTCLVCASMAGEKVSLLVIGEYAKPLAFKRANRLPIEYRANRKAWMTSTLFDEWLLKFDKRMRAEKCNVTLILDNCAAHSVNTAAVRNVSVYFLPPNTLSKTQLMDAGVIKNLKLHYHSQLVRQRLAAHEEGVSFQFNIPDSMRPLHRAWYMLEPETIINCYKSVGLHTDEREEEQGKTNDSSDFPSSDSDKNDWDALTRCIFIPDGVNFHDYVRIY